MTIIQSLVLGIIQGLTEFLPISSSAHLILVPKLLKWPEHSLIFDTSLHLGTTLAVILYFWRDWIRILKDKFFLFTIILGSIPAGLAGFFLGDIIEKNFRSQTSIAAFFLFGTIIMGISELYLKHAKKRRAGVYIKDSLYIGLMQILALLPGMSRSGMTISGGFFRKLERETATKFSFYLSAPIIITAAFFSFIKGFKATGNLSFFDLSFFSGFVTSFIIGFFSIKFMLSYIKRKGFGIFIFYRILLVVLILTLYLV